LNVAYREVSTALVINPSELRGAINKGRQLMPHELRIGTSISATWIEKVVIIGRKIKFAVASWNRSL